MNRGRRRLLKALPWAALGGVSWSPAFGAVAGMVANPRAHLYTYDLPADGERLVGRPRWVIPRRDDTLADVARRYDVGYWDIVRANPGRDFWTPGEGALVIPSTYLLPSAPREGVVINIPEMRLYYYPPPRADGRRVVITHPVGVGRQEWSTPLGVTRVVEKIPDPAWYPPASIRAEAARNGNPLPAMVPPGPKNPLGRYALILDLPGYLLHGTNRPAGVGMRVSHGCVRLYPEDIESLFPRIERGTPVRFVNEPVKWAWQGNSLIAEVHLLPGGDDFTRIDTTPHGDVLARARVAMAKEARRRGLALEPFDLLDLTERNQGLPAAVAPRRFDGIA